MVYKIENQRIVLENGELLKVTGVTTSVSKLRGSYADAEIITDTGKYRGTVERKHLKKAELQDIVSAVFLKDGLTDKPFETKHDAVEALSEEFRKAYELQGDGQEAYDYLFDDRMMHLLDDFDFVYTVTGGDYSVEIEESEASEADIIENVNDTYGVDTCSLKDAIYEVESQIDDTMSNVGCDPYTALSLEKEEGLLDCFKIVPASDEAYVELFEYLDV